MTNWIPTNGGAGNNEGSVVLTDFSQIAVARDLAPSVKMLEQTYADFDQQAIRVVARYDAAPLNPSAVILMRGVTSSQGICASPRRIPTSEPLAQTSEAACD